MSHNVYIFSTAFISSAFLVGLFRLWSIKKDWLAHPNHRSSHKVATPTGAGVTMVLLYGLGLVYFLFVSASVSMDLVWLAPLLLGVMGAVDDRVDLSGLLRFAIYAVVLVFAVAQYADAIKQSFAPVDIAWHWLAWGLMSLMLLWWVNLFNFMDGINGLAGLEAVYLILATLLLGNDVQLVDGQLSMLVVGSALGLLCWNFPKARVFMGDAGSIFLATFIGILALSAQINIWVFAILGAGFIVDASYTLAVRLLQKQKWYEAHRSHAYQKLARILGSHTKVVGWMMAINILWLLPMACYANKQVYYAPLIMLVAWLPLLGCCYKLQAGHVDK